MKKTLKSITFEAQDYNYPTWLPSDSMPETKPSITVTVAEIETAAMHGTTWEQLEAYYCIDLETLKQHFTRPYMQAKAQMQINVLHAMTTKAVDEKDATMLKWLSQNLLGMSDKSKHEINTTTSLSDLELSNRLETLLNSGSTLPTQE
jgi:hypothetical protein